MVHGSDNLVFPAERMAIREFGCKALENLRAICYLFVEIVVWDLFASLNASSFRDDALVAILESLNWLVASKFAIEMNIAIPGSVLAHWDI
ncbi:unnamed protein product [Periconia digitata]|uniref:Uncharacterized protein n=1 Tax=Periconia digitata TaxID=1303443 RepID=A0A9W4U9C0_9PLEO|nr:unnamed protein product [Periconia digitata]